jgi:hypothetical protein
MKTIAIVVNVIYYLSLIYMWYKIYSIGKHIIKKNKEHAHQQASVPAKEDESLSTETTNKEVISTTPQYDSEYMRKHGKELLIAIALVILVLFIKGFYL